MFPLGILLPIWLATAPGDIGATLYLCFMLAPITILLSFGLSLVITANANLPYIPLSWFRPGPVWVDVLYACVSVSLPMTVMLPIYYLVPLANSTRMALLVFMCIISALMMAIFSVSVYFRGGYRRTPDASPIKTNRISTTSSSSSLFVSDPEHMSLTGVNTSDKLKLVRALASVSTDVGTDLRSSSDSRDIRHTVRRSDSSGEGSNSFGEENLLMGSPTLLPPQV